MSDLAAWLVFVKENISPIQIALGGVAGFLVTRLTMTKKERVDAEQKIFENSRDLMIAQNARFQEFTGALQRYANKTDAIILDDFLSIANAGTNYFHQLTLISTAVLDSKVSSKARDETFVPAIKVAVDKTLPLYYEKLQSIAAKKSYEYNGKLRRSDYEAMYLVVEKYGPLITAAPQDEE